MSAIIRYANLVGGFDVNVLRQVIRSMDNVYLTKEVKNNG